MRRKLKNCFWLCSGEMARPQCAGRGDLLLVAVNYDEKTNAHACEIKRFVK